MTRSFRYGEECSGKILCVVVATLKIIRTKFYWKAIKLFESRGDVRPTTKGENERSGCILDPLERGGEC